MTKVVHIQLLLGKGFYDYIQVKWPLTFNLLTPVTFEIKYKTELLQRFCTGDNWYISCKLRVELWL